MDVTDHGVASDACQLGSWQLLMEDMTTFVTCPKPHVSRSKAGRPHSSPVRIPTESQQGQRRVHKTTTSRARSQQEMTSSECSLKNPPFIGAGEKILSQRPPASAGMAYFADHPPIVPLHIVVVKQNAEPNQIIPVSIAVTTSTDLCVSNNPDVGTSTDLKRSSSSGEYLVRRMLRDLMTTLPLRLVSSPASQTRAPSPDNFATDSIRVRSPRSRVRSPLVPAAVLPRMSPPQSVRSRGIGSSPPALAPASHRLNYSTFDQKMRILKKETFQKTTEAGPSSVALVKVRFNQEKAKEKGEGTMQEDWMGGVRALRDSHVRLVLRQLRHIDRLNRALDRFTKVASKR